MISLLLLLAAHPGWLQQPAAAPRQPDPAAQGSSPAAVPRHAEPSKAPPHEYRNEALQLVYRYPAELQPQTAKSFHETMERGHREHFGTEPESDPEHREAEKCMHVLLYAKTPETATGAFAVVTDGTHGPKTEITLAPSGTIILVEFDRSCVPAGTKDDDVLGSIASFPGQFPGLHPIDQQMWYEVDHHKVHFSAAQGAFEDAPDEPTAIAAASTAVEGHLLVWIFFSDDLAMLNRLLNAPVQFGEDKPMPLMPLSIGDGPPVKLVP